MDAAPDSLRGRIQIWTIYLEAPDSVVSRYREMLAADEAARAARFRFSHLERSFILARGGLRVLLGRYLNIAPYEIEFSYGLHGKPGLATAHRMKFNLSHSNELALIAFALDREIGVDVEHIRPISDLDAVAAQFFCAEEIAELQALPIDQREPAFFRCWTRKEAYLKALGEGVSAPLDNFRVTLLANEPARFVRLPHGAPEAWTLHNLEPAPQYGAALAYAGAPHPIEMLPPVTAAELVCN